MDKIYDTFIFWLRGLIEDDPIPYEIDTLVFYINSHNEIGFSGAETKNIKIVDLFFYYPLEAQFFYCPNLTNLMIKSTKKENLNYLKILLTKLKKDNYFKKFNFKYGCLFEKAKDIKL